MEIKRYQTQLIKKKKAGKEENGTTKNVQQTEIWQGIRFKLNHSSE